MFVVNAIDDHMETYILASVFLWLCMLRALSSYVCLICHNNYKTLILTIIFKLQINARTWGHSCRHIMSVCLAICNLKYLLFYSIVITSSPLKLGRRGLDKHILQHTPIHKTEINHIQPYLYSINAWSKSMCVIS